MARTKKINGRITPEELTTPIKITRPPSGYSPHFGKSESQHQKDSVNWYANNQLLVATEIHKKNNLLFEQYGIDKNDPAKWFFLSQKLAHEYVKGFRVEIKSPQGRPTKYIEGLLVEIFRAFITYRENHPKKPSEPILTDRAIANILYKEQRWKDEFSSPKKLYEHYGMAKKLSLLVHASNLLSHPDTNDSAYKMMEELIQDSKHLETIGNKIKKEKKPDIAKKVSRVREGATLFLHHFYESTGSFPMK
jgi:hypothetical protein